MPDPSPEVEIVRSPSPALVRELSLVLQSVGIRHRVVEGRHILVAASDADRALDHLAAYQTENPNRRKDPAPRQRVHEGAWYAAGAWVCALLFPFRLAVGRAFGVEWHALGRSDAEAILSGEVWRATTALGLHSGFAHLASNLVLGALFVGFLAQVLGPGPALLAALVAGTLGNLLNVLVVGAPHLSVGASTAVFGILGALAATQWFRKLRLGSSAAAKVIPFVAAAVMLGFYGVGETTNHPMTGVTRPEGDRTDVGAHFAGFLCGIAVGALTSRLFADHPPDGRARRALGWLALALYVGAWAVAVAAG